MKGRLLYLVNIPRFFMTHRLPLALAAQEAGYEVHVATSQYDRENVEGIRASGLEHHGLPLQQHGTHPVRELQALRGIVSLYRELRPHLTHHVTVKALLYGGLAARLTGVPAVVNTVSGLGYVFSSEDCRAAALRGPVSLGYRALLRHPNGCTIFQNPDDRDQFLRRGLVPVEQACVIRGSGVDMTRFTPQPEPEGIPRVLFAGRLLWQKGLDEYVDAARLLRAGNFPVQFVIAGYGEAGNPDSVPEATLDSWQRGGLIEYLGQRDDMPRVYAQSHLVCLPSWREGVPLALIEGAACGRALVATDVAGCREIVKQGVNGLLVPPRDPEALAEAICRLLEDDDLRRRMGEAGREIARREFSLERVVSETLALYDTLLARSGSPLRK